MPGPVSPQPAIPSTADGRRRRVRLAGALGTALLVLLLVAGAVGRVRSGATLSPPDLVFFFQSCWSAAHGAGFAQTALEFDHGSLFGSIHLSLIRLLQVPICRLFPQPEALVATQALGLAVAAAVAAQLARGDRGPGARLLGPAAAAGALAIVGLHPMTVALATVDMRPLTFLVPGAAVVAFGLVRDRAGLVVLGSAICVGAREEAPFVLAALVPLAWGRARSAQLALGVGLAAGLALPWLVWGHGGNIRTNTDPWSTVLDILGGERPLFRWHQETAFLGRVVVASLPAALAPELLLPALAGWLWILVFSQLEPAAPGQGGLHYLSVVAALLLPAVGLGLGRLWRRCAEGPAASLPFAVALGLVLVAGSPELVRLLEWAAAPRPAEQHVLVSALSLHSDPVLVPQHLAPAVAARPVVRIQGHFAATPERVEQVAQEVVGAVILSAPPPEPTAAREWALWEGALRAAGLRPAASAGTWTRWDLSSPGPAQPCSLDAPDRGS